MLLWMIRLTFCLSAVVSASLGPESLWADQDHLLKQGKILDQCTVTFGWNSFSWGTSYSCAVNLPNNVIYFFC